MPDSTPVHPAPLLPGVTNTAAQAVAAHFAGLPDVAHVVSQLLSDAIAQRYPALALDLSATRLATPNGKQWVFRPLLSVVQDYLGGTANLDFSDIGNLSFYLTTSPPRRLTLPQDGKSRLDMQVIEGLIKELADTVPVGLQNALNDYWRDHTGNGQWRWMARLLQDTLHIAALRRTDLAEPARQTLDQLTATPDREQRMSRHGAQAVLVYCLETTLRSAERRVTVLDPHLVLTRPTNGTATVLLCSPGGTIEAFPSMDALTQAWGQRMASGYHLDEVLIQRYEPDGDIFDHQAALILNQQLEHLGALRLPGNGGFAALQAHCRGLVDPTAYFLDAPSVPTDLLATLRTQLPSGLKDADSSAQAAYRRYSLALASAKRRGGGRTFLSGIPDIHAFTVASLLRELQADAVRLEGVAQADVAALDPDQLELTFAISAGYPGTVGITQHERMSLTDLAINNLSARPSGEMRIAHRAGLTVPGWLTADYLTGSNGLIERVDIGLHYPRLLEDQLLGPSEETRRRETLFADQLTAQLPLLALEQSLRGVNGMTRDGARRVAALMALTVADQQGVVIRHLALLRHPAASPDVVTNMYLIEAQDIASGPHILYRPLYAQALLEFPSRAALLEAIASPGEVQNSVLLWMSDSARPVYANGGFRQPHYLRFGQGDEFSPLRTPGPATLSEDGLNDELHQCLITGRLMQYLYSSNARALVAQADRESVSNHESRWKLLLEGGGLLFGGVLYPLLRGPLLLTTWLGNLYNSLKQDIQGLNAMDAQTRELASVDLLLNLGLSLFEGPPLPAGATAPARSRRPPLALPRQLAERWPAPPAPRIHQGSVGLPGVLPGTDKALLDFSFAQSHWRLTASQRARLNSYSTTPPPDVPVPVASGPHKGLYRIDNQWYAQVNGQWFRVWMEANTGDVLIVDPVDSDRRGPPLRDDRQGNWSVDTRLRLRGGMPSNRIAARRQLNAKRVETLSSEYRHFLGQQTQQQKRVDVAQAVMEKTQDDPRFTPAQRAEKRRQFENALLTQTQAYQQILESVQERRELSIPLSTQTVAALMENMVNNGRKLVVIAETDRQALYTANAPFTRLGTALKQAVLANRAGHEQFIKDLLAINERSIQWLKVKDRYLAQLHELGGLGLDAFTRLTQDRPDEISVLAIQALQIRTLRWLATRGFDSVRLDRLDTLIAPLVEQVRTHSELNALELPASERISVLESLVEHYGRALDALQGLNIVDVEGLEQSYSAPLFMLIEELYQDVNLQLANAIQPSDPNPVRTPKRQPTAPGKPQKKVIRTRRKGTLIGDLKPAGSSLPIEVVEVRSEESNQLLSLYSQDGDEWVEFKEPLAPPPPAPSRGLSLVKGEARKLLAMLDAHLQRAQRYRSVCRHPEEVQEILHYEGTRYDRLATELDRTIQALPLAERLAADLALATQLREAGMRLTRQGDALRLQLSLELPPTHGNLEYLLAQKQVAIARYSERVPLSGERRDFIQEYAVTDLNGAPLWYAHFHYPKHDTPKADYSVAHLKTKAQQKQSYYSLLAKTQNPQAVVNVHRGLIGKALAERWFLPLAP